MVNVMVPTKVKSTELAPRTSKTMLMELDSHQKLVERFAKWIYSTTVNGKIVNEDECAAYIQSINNGMKILDENVTAWVSESRKYCAENLGEYIIRIRMRGWRIATSSDERMDYLGSELHKIAKNMDRGKWLFTAAKKHELERLSKRLHSLKGMKKVIDDSTQIRSAFEDNFIQMVDDRLKQLKLEESKEIKKIEAK